MTSEQQKQWYDFACGPRCLLELSKYRNITITVDDFIQKFSPKYPEWGVRCGVTCTSELIDIARDLNLCNNVAALRNKSKIKEILKNRATLGILVLTDVKQNDVNQELYHCRLLIVIKNNIWVLFHPDQSGQDMYVHETEASLDDQLAHFLHFY